MLLTFLIKPVPQTPSTATRKSTLNSYSPGQELSSLKKGVSHLVDFLVQSFVDISHNSDRWASPSKRKNYTKTFRTINSYVCRLILSNDVV